MAHDEAALAARITRPSFGNAVRVTAAVVSLAAPCPVCPAHMAAALHR
ncbi:hypothetical protein [Yinghuangia sp. YIM S09857]